MNISRKLKKLYWLFDAYISSKRYPLNPALTYFAVTGTDGKTTTSTFLYEIARNLGYKPLLITTVGGKFDGEDITLDIKSSSFFAYSMKTFVQKLTEFKLVESFRALFLLDKEGFSKQSEKHRTTPLSSEIFRIIREYESKGANLFILETTSHSLDQYRIFGIEFDSIAFTNITNEHLDYHGTWENYAETKAKLIKMVKDGGTIVINKDDEKSYEFLKKKVEDIGKKKSLNLVEYKIADFEKVNPANFLIKIKKFAEVSTSESMSSSQILADEYHSQTSTKNQYKASITILGRYNLWNALAAFGCFYGFNPTNPEGIAKGISLVKGISGRMEVLSKDPEIIVDFAHTPNGMLNALRNIRVREGGRLWVIFGCAGERDKYKRPEMGRIAFENADNILITSEDARSENLFQINNEIIEGFRNIDEEFTIENYYEGLEYKPEGKFITRFDEPNLNSRINAIKFAIQKAKPHDTIIILGKGHETSMNFGGIEYEWNDVEFVRDLISK